MNNNYKALSLLFIFSVLYSLFFIHIYPYPILGDGHTYYLYGVNLYKGNGYSYYEFPPFIESNLREPGYPFFIYGLFKIFATSKYAIQILQAILNGIIVLITYNLANLAFDKKKIALTAAFLTAVSPTIAGYAPLVASETLATVCLVLMFLFFMLLLKEKKSIRAIGFSILVGFFYGYLVLTKMVYFMFFPLICLALFMMLAGKFTKHNISKAALYIVCITLLWIGVISPWFSFNNRVYGNPFFLTNRGGMALAIKAERLNWTRKEIAASFLYPISEGLIERYFPNEYKKVSYNPVDGSVFKIAFDKYDSLIKLGFSEMAADRHLRVEALNKIRGNILKYIILSVSDFHYMLYFEGLPLSQFTDFFKRGTMMAINASFKIYSLIIILFAIKGIFIMMYHKEGRTLRKVFLLPVFYTFFIYSAIFGAPRFAFAIIPFIYILASISICEMFNRGTPL